MLLRQVSCTVVALICKVSNLELQKLQLFKFGVVIIIALYLSYLHEAHRRFHSIATIVSTPTYYLLLLEPELYIQLFGSG